MKTMTTGKKIVEKYCKHQGYGNYSVDENKLIKAIIEAMNTFSHQQVMGFIEWKERYKIEWDIKLRCYILPGGQEVKTKELLYEMYILS